MKNFLKSSMEKKNFITQKHKWCSNKPDMKKSLNKSVWSEILNRPTKKEKPEHPPES